MEIHWLSPDSLSQENRETKPSVSYVYVFASGSDWFFGLCASPVVIG